MTANLDSVSVIAVLRAEYMQYRVSNFSLCPELFMNRCPLYQYYTGTVLLADVECVVKRPYGTACNSEYTLSPHGTVV
jgi:hypothetical protein